MIRIAPPTLPRCAPAPELSFKSASFTGDSVVTANDISVGGGLGTYGKEPFRLVLSGHGEAATLRAYLPSMLPVVPPPPDRCVVISPSQARELLEKMRSTPKPGAGFSAVMHHVAQLAK